MVGISVDFTASGFWEWGQTLMGLCFDLVEGGYITAAQALAVLEGHLASRTPIGQLAVENDLMTMS